MELFGQLELVWVANNNEEKGMVIHISHPAGIPGQSVSDRTNNWLPVFFISLEKEESKDWCAPLDVKVREQHNMRESWAEKTERMGHSDNKPDMFLQVNKSEYKVSISFEGGISGENLLALHPNGTIRVSGAYGKGLLAPMQFLPINKDLPVWNLSKHLLPSVKTMSGHKFPGKAAACWPPLV